MTEPRYTSPVPPYQPQDDRPAPDGRASDSRAHGPAVEGVVVGGPGSGRSPYAGPRGGRPRFVRQKSLLLAGLLALLFPPIGMLYSTIFGTLVMIFIGVPLLLLTAGHASAVLWPMCVVWAVWAAHRTNQRRLAWAALGF